MDVRQANGISVTREFRGVGDLDDPAYVEAVLRIGNRLKQEEQAKRDLPRAEPPLDWAALQGDPPARSWWIQDWLSPTPTFFAGAGGKGKTTLLQAISTALATNKPFIEAPTAADLRVLIWNCEDDRDEIWRKQCAINSHLNIAMTDLNRLHIVPRVGLENTLMTLKFGGPSFTSTFVELSEQVNDLDIDVLVVDNISQVYGGMSDQHQVTQFVNAMAGIVRGRPFAPILVGHVARAQGSEFSGSAAWENSVRMRWYLGSHLPDQKPDEDADQENSDIVYLARRKANYAAKDWIRLKFQNGLLVPDQPIGTLPINHAFRAEAAEIVVLSAIPKLIEAGIQPSDKPQSSDFLPKAVIALRHHQNHNKDELTKAMQRLMGAGRLRRVEVGKYSNRNPKYGLVIV